MSYKMMSGGEGVCLECGAPFRGRSDKHFCSLSCKNAYHNRAQQTRRRHRSDILAVLTSGIRKAAPLILIYVMLSELVCSVAYVFRLSLP